MPVEHRKHLVRSGAEIDRVQFVRADLAEFRIATAAIAHQREGTFSRDPDRVPRDRTDEPDAEHRPEPA